MATTDEIKPILQGLLDAYPSFKAGPGTFQQYSRHLSRFSAAAIQEAADAWVLENEWFPKINQLVRTCEWNDNHNRTNTGEVLGGELRVREVALQDDAANGDVDLDAWRGLIEEYRLAGREFAAESAEMRLMAMEGDSSNAEYWYAAELEIVP